jgi:hypothetical protein
MNSKNIVINAYKGLLYNFYLDLKTTALIGLVIVSSTAVFNIVLALIFLNINGSSSNDGSGALFIGGVIMLITFIIHIIASTSIEGIHGKFSFPINRLIYAVSNFMFMIFGSFVLLAILTIFAPFEVLIYRFIELLTGKLLYLNTITLDSFLIGFISSWAYLFSFASIAYALFMYIRRYLLYTLPILTILILCVFLFGWFGDIIAFTFLETNLYILLLKLVGIAIVSHILGFIPLKRLEVQ